MMHIYRGYAPREVTSFKHSMSDLMSEEQYIVASFGRQVLNAGRNSVAQELILRFSDIIESLNCAWTLLVAMLTYRRQMYTRLPNRGTCKELCRGL